MFQQKLEINKENILSQLEKIKTTGKQNLVSGSHVVSVLIKEHSIGFVLSFASDFPRVEIERIKSESEKIINKKFTVQKVLVIITNDENTNSTDGKILVSNNVKKTDARRADAPVPQPKAIEGINKIIAVYGNSGQSITLVTPRLQRTGTKARGRTTGVGLRLWLCTKAGRGGRATTRSSVPFRTLTRVLIPL